MRDCGLLFFGLLLLLDEVARHCWVPLGLLSAYSWVTHGLLETYLAAYTSNSQLTRT